MAEIKPIEAEVLVIGAGIAGIRAAIESHDRGSEVILVNKGALGQDGAATWMAGLGHEVALYPPDSAEVHARDCIVAGKYLANQELVYTLLKLGPQNVKELWKWGVRFPRDDEGRFLLYHLPGHTYARSMSHRHYNVPGKGYRGPELRQALTRQIRRKKIKVMEDLFITDLLTRDSTVVGAVGIDLSDGEFKVFRAKSTILATGGHMCCYKFLDAGNASTGDGHAMAYRAGAKLMDMEFIQFLITSLWPPSVQGGATPYEFILFFAGWLLNNRGERFMERYSPERKEWTRREVFFNAIASEVAAGRGSPHGGVYLALNHLPRNLVNLEDRTIPFLRTLQEAGIDLRQDAIEVGPGAHYAIGGCWINEKAETSLDGLYALGEVASGFDGADRLPGMALPACMALGTIGGREGSLRAQAGEMPQIDEGQVEKLKGGTFAPLERKEGVSPVEIRNKIQDTMQTYAVFNRNRDGLEAALKAIGEVKGKLLPNMCLSAKNKRFNLEWVEAMEVTNMADVAEMICRSALMRTESRGLHQRFDYPKTDPEWVKNIMSQRVNGKMVLTTKQVAFPYVKPEE